MGIEMNRTITAYKVLERAALVMWSEYLNNMIVDL
jgi:hypothetical protein